ncbi:hypothetical protein C4D60_Mb00t04690 [Musa balbisiana]|uniref:Uncharacterized protein n=1 Tax=Musa balbisiana TaxID=52838 RepID=A0A4S8I5D0_MUSBA|nr:hypothetical protein C4D60_Mb00t04690 [Musa balbisiana]
MTGCNLIMSKLVDVAPTLYGKCQTLGTTRVAVRNRNKEKREPLKWRRGISCISSFVPHSNWGSKSTKFDDLLRERRSKSMLLKTLQHMSGRPPLIVYEQNTSPKVGSERVSLMEK